MKFKFLKFSFPITKYFAVIRTRSHIQIILTRIAYYFEVRNNII